MIFEFARHLVHTCTYMIIIIASEVPNLASAVAGELINLETGRQYFRDGDVIDHGDKPAPAYPVYTSGNRVFTLIVKQSYIYNTTGEPLSHTSIQQLVNNGYAVLKAKGIATQFLPDTYGLATTKSKLGRIMPTIRFNFGGIHQLLDKKRSDSPADIIGNRLGSIFIAPTRETIRIPHNSLITDLECSMLRVYDAAVKCNVHVKLMSHGPVNQLCWMLSDFWIRSSVNSNVITALPGRVCQIGGDNAVALGNDKIVATDYLHPVEHWPAGSDIPEYRTDLCTGCKSRLFAANYAAYRNDSHTLHAFCPLCVHCSPIGRSRQYSSWYTFTHPRNALELLEERFTKLPGEFPEDIREFLTAVATHGYNHAGKVIRTPDADHNVVCQEIIDDISLEGKVFYGKKIKVIKPLIQ